jgi:hypothetical protein
LHAQELSKSQVSNLLLMSSRSASILNRRCLEPRLTCSGSVFPKVSSLVPAEDALSLDRWSGTSGKFLVEADDALHANCIRCCANRLVLTSALPFSFLLPLLEASCTRMNSELFRTVQVCHVGLQRAVDAMVVRG